MTPKRKDIELNEVLWWSRWASLRWHGEGYLLTSEALTEPFFNRAGALSCGAVARTVAWAESAFSSTKMNSTVLVFDSCRAVKALLAAGYREVDVMKVLFSKGWKGREGGGRQNVMTSTDPDRWTAAYLRSFYGSEELVGVVTPIVASLMKAGTVTLLEARVRGDTAGVLAVSRSARTSGVYCVGTVPEYRNQGVATGLLAKAWEIATAEGRSLVLQTLVSEGALRFYLRRGFEVMYSKHVLEKKTQMKNGTSSSRWIWASS